MIIGQIPQVEILRCMLIINFITKSSEIMVYSKRDDLSLSSVKCQLIRSTSLLSEIYIAPNTSEKESLGRNEVC